MQQPMAGSRNAPAVIGGRPYSGHALDRMQDRGYTPTTIENAIRSGSQTRGRGGVFTFRDRTNGITVHVNPVTNNVITVYPSARQ